MEERFGREEPRRLDATLIADLREAHQRLLAVNERLQEMRQRREGGPPAAGGHPRPRG